MGYGNYSLAAHAALTAGRAHKSGTQVFMQTQCHPLMNPKGLKVRECRDSADHPDSLGIAFALDVTGSMGDIGEWFAANVFKNDAGQTGIAMLVVFAILLFVLAGVSTGKGDWSRVTQGQHATQLWWVALLQVNFAYSGWNAAAYLAGETVNPR